MSLREMVFGWAEHFFTLPSVVEELPFWQFCEEYNDYKLRTEWQEYVKANSPQIEGGRARVPVLE